MATKLPKITLPRTSDGFQKKLDYLQEGGIETREDAYRFAYLMFHSIDFELKRLEEAVAANKEQAPALLIGLIQRYKPLRDRWEKKLQFTIDNIETPLEDANN